MIMKCVIWQRLLLHTQQAWESLIKKSKSIYNPYFVSNVGLTGCLFCSHWIYQTRLHLFQSPQYIKLAAAGQCYLFIVLSVLEYKRTILAAVDVCISFQTVSESTPIPPHGSKQNRIGKLSAMETVKASCKTIPKCVRGKLYVSDMQLKVAFL